MPFCNRTRRFFVAAESTRRRAGLKTAGLSLLLLTLLALAAWPGGRPSLAMPSANVMLAGQRFALDLADTPALQSRGLGGRKNLGPRAGMLFLYAERGSHVFWMKGMLIAIDMIWLDNSRIVHIEHRVPPPAPGTALGALPTYGTGVSANAVLEIAAGRAAELGLAVGDSVRFNFASN